MQKRPSIDEVIDSWRTGAAEEIANWNAAHGRGEHPVDWDLTNGKGRGITISGTNIRICLHNLQLCKLNVGVTLCFEKCDYNGAIFDRVEAETVRFKDCIFEHVRFIGLRWHQATFTNCRFIDCEFASCDFSRSTFLKCSVRTSERNVGSSNSTSTDMQDTIFDHGEFSETSITGVTVSGTSSLAYVLTDQKCFLSFRRIGTSVGFDGLSLAIPRFDPQTQSQIALHQQRSFWKARFREKPVSSLLWRFFWFLSGYGFSLRRLVTSTLLLLAIFTVVVYQMSLHGHFPDLVPSSLPTQTFPQIHRGIRSLYFVVVTMTTLGFGDVSPDKGSASGALFIVLCSVTGYTLFGLFIARVATSTQWPK